MTSSITEQIRAQAATAEPLKSASKGDGYTPYAIGTLINETLKELGYEGKPVQPQRMYNYAKSGQINGVKRENGSDERYTEAEAIAFVARFLKRNHADLLNLEADEETDDTGLDEELKELEGADAA